MAPKLNALGRQGGRVNRLARYGHPGSLRSTGQVTGWRQEESGCLFSVPNRTIVIELQRSYQHLRDFSRRHGGFTKWLLQVARVDVLLLDDWGMAPLDAMVRNDLLEMIR